MTPEEILTLLKDMKEDERSKILDSFKPKEPPKPQEPPNPQEPPKPADLPKPQDPPKADSVIKMTAAEFMRLIEEMKPKDKDKDKKPKGDDNDAELFL